MTSIKELTCFTIQTAFVTNNDGNSFIGIRSLLYSSDPNSLTLWERHLPSGSLTTVVDTSIHSNVIELTAEDNAPANFIAIPVRPFKSLHIRQPIFVMIVKNIHRCFSFEMMILDTDGMSRKLLGSTVESELKISKNECVLPLHFTDGWNQVQIDLTDFNLRCFGTIHAETSTIKVSSNCQLHRIYFCESINNNIPHKFSSSSMLHSNMDTFPGGSGDGFDILLH